MLSWIKNQTLIKGRLSDYFWGIGKVKNTANKMDLFCGDCMTYLKNVPNKSMTCTVTDIPQGEVNRKSNGLRNLDKKDADIVTFSLEDFVEEVCRVTSGSIYIFW